MTVLLLACIQCTMLMCLFDSHLIVVVCLVAARHELNSVELARGLPPPPPLLRSREVRRFSACPPPSPPSPPSSSSGAVAADFQHLRDQPSPSLTVMPRQTEGEGEGSRAIFYIPSPP